MYYITLSCTSSLCSFVFLNPGVYGLVQATVDVGTVLIWDFCVAYTRGGGVTLGHCFTHVMRMSTHSLSSPSV